MAGAPAEVPVLRAALPPWILVATFEGSGGLAEDKLAYQEADFRDTLAVHGLEPLETLGTIHAEQVRTALREPSGEPYWKLRYRGGVKSSSS